MRIKNTSNEWFDREIAEKLSLRDKRFLKDGAKYLTTLITRFCNLLISCRTFPDACKIEKLKPLFKKGTRTDPKNYRPMSLPPLISKVLERVIHEQTTEVF